MKRLTDKRLALPPGVWQEATDEQRMELQEIPVPSKQDLYYRLSQIEDILGGDYDLDRLRELVKMDRANSVPPCQIGDVFYAIDWSRWGSEVKEYRISMLQQKRDKTWRIRAKDTQSDYQVDWAYDDYRERAYSTREAAEAALKAREQDG